MRAPTESFPYQIDRQVGIGSMGVVYKAVEVPLDRPVAIKALRQSLLDEEPPDVREELRRRFLQEARAAAALSHPGVTTVYRVGKEGELPYIVMEWLDGRSLDEVLKTRSRFEFPEALRLVISLLETLDAAHRQGVVHRDIKPSNLMLLADGRLKVTDFGIALLKGRELVKTQAGVVLATPKFASPEQLRGLDVDGRADLFAAGILLYRILTGTFPFEGPGFTELAAAILQHEPIPVREHVDVPPAFEAVLRKSLRKSRKDRFATAGQMADELRRFQTEGSGEADTGPRVPRDRAGRRSETSRTAGNVRREKTGGGIIYLELPLDREEAMVRIATSWPPRRRVEVRRQAAGGLGDRTAFEELPHQSTRELLDRLLDQPLHAPPFTGAVKAGNAWLLIAEGVLVAAFDPTRGACGDEVVESLPLACAPSLHPLPEGHPRQAVRLFATFLDPPPPRAKDLDTTLINLPAFTRKLRAEVWDGVLRLRLGEAFGAIFFAAGTSALSLFSGRWGEVPVERDWREWLTDFPARASVEDLHAEPLEAWYRRSLRGLELDVEPPGSGPGGRHLTRVPGSGSPSLERLSEVEHVAALRCLRFLIDGLPGILSERQRTPRWKYLGEWIPRISKAFLYCDLPRPGNPESDAFDFVTADGDGKVLHVGQRVARLSELKLREFVERVIAAKKARIKTGDVGAALLFASEIGDEVLDAYREMLGGSSKAWFGVEDLTGYAGFVRIGARRGFHLLLVEETSGGFKPWV